ncbi:MAG TPA: hypothetical protein PLX05_07500 [Acinetobacter parvus]|nr:MULTISPECIES: hypothetical protein [Acinetobacter]HRM15465.1 hypothetical protein [Acinetobacter parvus]
MTDHRLKRRIKKYQIQHLGQNFVDQLFVGYIYILTKIDFTR